MALKLASVSSAQTVACLEYGGGVVNGMFLLAFRNWLGESEHRQGCAAENIETWRGESHYTALGAFKALYRPWLTLKHNNVKNI